MTSMRARYPSTMALPPNARAATHPGGAPRPDAVRSVLLEHAVTLRRDFGIRRLDLIGSVARDEARPDSDVDLLADFGGAPSYRAYIGALLYLEDLLGRKVDLITEGALDPRISEAVMAQRTPVLAVESGRT